MDMKNLAQMKAEEQEFLPGGKWSTEIIAQWQEYRRNAQARIDAYQEKIYPRRASPRLSEDATSQRASSRRSMGERDKTLRSSTLVLRSGGLSASIHRDELLINASLSRPQFLTSTQAIQRASQHTATRLPTPAVVQTHPTLPVNNNRRIASRS
jgi:hypothetical protein